MCEGVWRCLVYFRGVCGLEKRRRQDKKVILGLQKKADRQGLQHKYWHYEYNMVQENVRGHADAFEAYMQ